MYNNLKQSRSTKVLSMPVKKILVSVFCTWTWSTNIWNVPFVMLQYYLQYLLLCHQSTCTPLVHFIEAAFSIWNMIDLRKQPKHKPICSCPTTTEFVNRTCHHYIASLLFVDENNYTSVAIKIAEKLHSLRWLSCDWCRNRWRYFRVKSDFLRLVHWQAVQFP